MVILIWASLYRRGFNDVLETTSIRVIDEYKFEFGELVE
jgi:hypothetical protein